MNIMHVYIFKTNFCFCLCAFAFYDAAVRSVHKVCAIDKPLSRSFCNHCPGQYERNAVFILAHRHAAEAG